MYLLKKNKTLRLKIRYIKLLLKIYALMKNILPKISNKLKKHIEKISLDTGKNVYDIVSKNKR